jgi:hypothetical protein
VAESSVVIAVHSPAPSSFFLPHRSVSLTGSVFMVQGQRQRFLEELS